MAGSGARAGLKGCVKPSSLPGRRRGTNRDPSVHVRSPGPEPPGTRTHEGGTRLAWPPTLRPHIFVFAHDQNGS